MKHLLPLLVGLAIATGVMAGPAPKRVYIPMDYSTAGYMASETDIPDVGIAVCVPPTGKDDSKEIQKAIDYVSALPADKDGHRGAVLLTDGTYLIDKAITISQSGVVLRGSGEKTVLKKTGFDRGAAIYVRGSQETIIGDKTTIKGNVRAGATALRAENTDFLKNGDRVEVFRPCTKEWIASLAMNDFGGGLDYTGWKESDIDLSWTREVTAVKGDSIFLDSPITCSIDEQSGGAEIRKSENKGEIRECGVENLRIVMAVNDWNPKDEDHTWDGIHIDYARDCWVRKIWFCHTAGSAVNIQKGGSRITVEDCIASEPVSEIGGWRRRTFLTRGQQCLFQRCVSKDGINDFVTDFCAAGPNAFVQCEGLRSKGFSGSVGSWAPGILMDIVDIDGGDIKMANLEQYQMGTGWNTANSMAWQCTAANILIYSPDTVNVSSGHGCWGTLTGNGHWTSSNDHVSPRSLFYAQLEKRIGKDKRDGRILPRDDNATSSPTVEQAAERAMESLTTRRLTLEEWIGQQKFSASTSADGVKKSSELTVKEKKDNKRKENKVTAIGCNVENGNLTVGGEYVVGTRYAIPWWNGRTKDNFTKNGASAAVTRFVPGREGIGWTDHIDSVVTMMEARNFGMLDHHYGLWYDLRRIDHERVRRSDGEVCPPFYEQPFARSGVGTAWDGLSKYDLTKPNEWYWQRLRQFASSAANHGKVLYCEHYFQHNILEAGAHWVDCPWRPENNINDTYHAFPEPVHFAGDKRIFYAEQFYDTKNERLVALHKGYIRMCLEEMKDNPNAIHVLSDEYTGPEHFVRFWLETIAEWEKETGRNVLVALSCTKDAQDAILKDENLSKTIDIIDIRYWHYNTAGLWAPEAGKNMAPRQWMRKMKVGKTSNAEAYKAVSEYRKAYPDKAVTFFSQQYPSYGWAILMGGGSLANVKIDSRELRTALKSMTPAEGDGCWILECKDGILAYKTGDGAKCQVPAGKYDVMTIDETTGAVRQKAKKQNLSGDHKLSERITWLKRL
ncbi:MAG: pectate lyase [Bacteroidales bacterium]|nr:pectate lyase [Bacteroidales bacterium]